MLQSFVWGTSKYWTGTWKLCFTRIVVLKREEHFECWPADPWSKGAFWMLTSRSMIQVFGCWSFTCIWWKWQCWISAESTLVFLFWLVFIYLRWCWNCKTESPEVCFAFFFSVSAWRHGLENRSDSTVTVSVVPVVQLASENTAMVLCH